MTATDDWLEEALRFVTMSADERLAVLREFQRGKRPKAMRAALDDAVMEELRARRFIATRSVSEAEARAMPAGATIATDGLGGLFVTEATEEGRAWLASRRS